MDLMREKSAFCLTIALKAKEFISDKESKKLIESAIKIGYKWIDEGCDVSEELYNYLDNEESGFTIFREREEDERIADAWDCVIDAVAFICKSAYLGAGEKYFPEPVELVDDSTIDHMIKSFLRCSGQDLEINIRNEKVLRLWSDTGCVEMNETYQFQKYLPNVWAIGDDEGGYAIVCEKGENGIYAVSFSDLDDDEKIFLANSVSDIIFGEAESNAFLSL